MNDTLTAIASKVAAERTINMEQVLALRAYKPTAVRQALMLSGLDDELVEQMLFGKHLMRIFPQGDGS